MLINFTYANNPVEGNKTSQRWNDTVVSVVKVQESNSRDLSSQGVPWDVPVIGGQQNSGMYVSNTHTCMCNPVVTATQNMSLGGFFGFFWLHRKQSFLQGQTRHFLLHATYTFQNNSKHLFFCCCFKDHQWKPKQVSKKLKLFQGEGTQTHISVCFLLFQCWFLNQTWVTAWPPGILLPGESPFAHTGRTSCCSFFPSCVTTVLQSGRKIWFRQ